MESESKKILSICIPTYNRGNIVFESIKKLLEFNSEDIEIVVCDNGSSDNTYSLISSIKDKRLKIYRNDSNMGFIYNLMRVVKLANGYFACTLSDEDSLIEKTLDELISLIKSIVNNKLNIMGIVCDFEKPDKIAEKIDQYMGVLYGRCSYISGLVFNREKMINSDFEIEQTIYPHVFLMLKLALRGEIIFSDSLLHYQREHGANSELEESGAEVNRNSYVLPQMRLKQLREDMMVVGKINMEIDTKVSIFNRIFNIKLFQGVSVYNMIIRSNDMRKYFKIKYKSDYKETINLFIQEYLTILYDLKITLTDDIKCFIIESGSICTNVMRKRDHFDDIAHDDKYKIIFVGDLDLNMTNIKNLDKYNFKIDYYLDTSSHTTDFFSKDKLIKKENLKDFENILFILGEDQGYDKNLLLNADKNWGSMEYSTLRLQF